MSERLNWESWISALLYPILFDKNPLDRIEHRLKMIPQEEQATYLTAIRMALASPVTLSDLLPGMVPEEEIVRKYLAALESRLRR